MNRSAPALIIAPPSGVAWEGQPGDCMGVKEAPWLAEVLPN